MLRMAESQSAIGPTPSKSRLPPARTTLRRRGSGEGHTEQLRHLVHVLVAPAGEIEHDHLVAAELLRPLEAVHQRVRAFECRDDALESRAELEGLEHFLIERVGEIDPV